ncbi:Transcriptional regulator [hydrothermal vent metagenome]|uniref:Transcriptional regulator n=1 Tax=hydrothermal vent metagenome TaxID=652676 RepID=A0A1W1E807_9ZZZZ
MKKQDYHHGNLKEQSLKIAFDFIREHGVEELTLKVLSDATHTSRSAIYRHFKSKDALIETIITTGFEQFDTAVSPVLLQTDTPLVERFYLGGKAYIDYARNNPNLYRLLFGKKYAHIREEVIQLGDECSGFGALKKTIEEGQAKGLLKKEESFTQTVVVWSSLHGLASVIIDGFMDVESSYESYYDAMFESLLAGLVTKKISLVTSLPFVKKMIPSKENV